MEEGCKIEISAGSGGRNAASVAAVIKPRAVGHAGSSLPLMSVCSVCSVVLPCGLLLKRRPWMDEACPMCVCCSLHWWVNHKPVNSVTTPLNPQ